MQDNEVKNRCSDIDFNHYHAGEFSVAVEGRRLGRIIDLGNASELEKAYGYQETVDSNQGFASLRLQDHKRVVIKDGKAQAVQELRQSARRAYGSRLGSTWTHLPGANH